MTPARAALNDALLGATSAVNDLEGEDWADLRTAAAQPALILTAHAVAAVFSNYIEGQASRIDVQRWAALMRWGYVAGRSNQALDITFEPSHEDAIVEALARLDELGDVIDGEISAAEADELLRGLE